VLFDIIFNIIYRSKSLLLYDISNKFNSIYRYF
jgi:hypothetical protein